MLDMFVVFGFGNECFGYSRSVLIPQDTPGYKGQLTICIFDVNLTKSCTVYLIFTI